MTSDRVRSRMAHAVGRCLLGLLMSSPPLYAESPSTIISVPCITPSVPRPSWLSGTLIRACGWSMHSITKKPFARSKKRRSRIERPHALLGRRIGSGSEHQCGNVQRGRAQGHRSGETSTEPPLLPPAPPSGPTSTPLSKRYVATRRAARASLDKAYADAMRTVWRAYPTTRTPACCSPKLSWTCGPGIFGRRRVHLSRGRKRSCRHSRR